MADVISLKSHRKAKVRAAKDQTAAENRALYGMSKAEKQRLRAEKAGAATKLDGHKKSP